MKHAGIARRAALKLILPPLLAVIAAGLLGLMLGWPAWLAGLAGSAAALWLLFAGFTVYFFRNPQPIAVLPRALPPRFDFLVRDRHSCAKRARQRQNSGPAACAGPVYQRA